MFTGLIEDCGSIDSLRRTGNGMQVSVQTGLPVDELNLGDSVAVNGACLTVVAKGSASFSADMSPETYDRTTFSSLVRGSRVNLERALRVGDRLGGHIVTGHVDAVGKVISVRTVQNAVVIGMEVPADWARYLVPKGSVAIDGISLTVNDVTDNRFSVSVIPHTLAATTLADCKAGDAVNIETDILGKYVERLLGHGAGVKGDSKVTGEFLAKHGFM